jgi:hypothetical protein
MTSRPVSMTRPAFTLLEMVLAASITVLLLAALYVAVDIQLRHAAAARELVEQSTLVRTLVNRIANDIEPSVNLVDPSRFQSGSGSSTSGSSTTGSSTSGSSTTVAPSGATTSGTGTTSSNNSTTTGASSSSTTTVIPPPLLLLQGTTDTLTIWISRVPSDPNNPNMVSNPFAQLGLSDTRRIDYWLAGGGGLGLARLEQTAVTGDDAAPGTMPPDVSDANSKQIIAPEVKSLQFQYFDGSAWQDSWDGTVTGTDGVTPLGPPAAVAITIGLAPIDGGELKTYRHVIGIQTSNGSTSAQISSTDGITTTITLNSPSSSTNGSSSDSTSSTSP